MNKVKQFIWKFYKPILIILLVLILDYLAVLPLKLILKLLSNANAVVALVIAFVAAIGLAIGAGIFLYKYFLKYRYIFDVEGSAKEKVTNNKICKCERSAYQKKLCFNFTDDDSIITMLRTVKDKNGFGFLEVTCNLDGVNLTKTVKIDYCPVCGGKFIESNNTK